MSWYCAYAAARPHHHAYHDNEYGLPLEDERALFELLSIEIFQAGLSWDLILRKRAAIVAAFGGFAVDAVAAYGEQDVARLLADPGIIRNRLKVASIISNADTVIALRESHGGFAAWIAAHHPQNRADWTKLFRRTFKFMGPEIVNEFLMCIGYLPGAHSRDCAAYQRIAEIGPPWMSVDPKVYGEE